MATPSKFAKYEQFMTFLLRFPAVYSMIIKTINRGHFYEDQNKGYGL